MNTVTVFDYDIPVWEHYTAGERERLEALIASQDETTRTRYDLEAVRIFLKTRLKLDVKIDDLLDKPVKGDELAEAVEVLCSPLFVILKERAWRREKARAESLTDPNELAMRIQHHKDILETLESRLSESDGPNAGP